MFDPDPTAVSSSAPTIAQRVSDVSRYIGEWQNVITALAAFLTVGVGGLWIAFRKVYSQIRGIGITVGGIENAVEPVRHEITERDNDTLSSRVDIITATLDKEKVARELQHAANSGRLDHIETSMDKLQDDVAGIRKVLDRILAKMANI